MDKQAILGSKISLISRAGIRYEGILYTIDTHNSTVSLAKVKSYGTEDRYTENVVPARPEVYDYIIFRGKDIQDLHVCEPPTARDQLMTQDPSIVKVAGKATKEYSPRPFSRKFERSSRVDRYNDSYDNRRSNYGRQYSYFNRPKPSDYYSSPPPSSRWLARSISPSRRDPRPRDFPRRRPNPPPNRWRSNSRSRNSTVPTKSYEKDYDFETANAEIAKELERLSLETTDVCGGDGDSEGTRAIEEQNSISPTTATSNHGDTNFYYNSKRSFFDNISSEVTDRAKGKTIRPLNWRDESKLNVETFGAPRLRRVFLRGPARGPNRYDYYNRRPMMGRRRNGYSMVPPNDYYYGGYPYSMRRSRR